jgi:SAM-dependent methyltransferase
MREVLGQMRQEWDLIARRNAFYGVVSWPEFEALDRVDRDRFWALGKESVDNFLAQLPLGDIRAGTMVEIGCGLGRMTHRFAERFNHVYAVDVSPEMLTRAKTQWAGLTNVDFILGHGNDLPGIADHSVDFVFSFIVLQHVPDQTIVKDYLRETARVLKPDALAYLQFRTDVMVTALRESLAFRAVRAVTHPRRALNTLVARLGSWVFPPRVIQSLPNPSLADEFSRFESWQGCALDPGEVESLASSLGLRIENVSGVGTQYTFYTFRRS